MGDIFEYVVDPEDEVEVTVRWRDSAGDTIGCTLPILAGSILRIDRVELELGPARALAEERS